MSDYAIRQLQLPARVKGVIVVDADSFANIYVNTSLSYKSQLTALKHELKHLERDDVYNDRDINDVENS